MSRRSVGCALIVAAWVAASPPALAQAVDNCGPLRIEGHYGPFDYRTQRDKLDVVDHYHFTPQVEALIRGESSYIGGDLDYVLKSSPNHHRALVSMTRLAERGKTDKPQGATFTIDCYYIRATRYAADDVVVRALYAQYLNRQRRQGEALQQLEVGREAAKDDGFSHYNLGLVYFELGRYQDALTEAWRARELGFDREELPTMLKRVNKWSDAPATPATGASGAASSAVDVGASGTDAAPSRP